MNVLGGVLQDSLLVFHLLWRLLGGIHGTKPPLLGESLEGVRGLHGLGIHFRQASYWSGLVSIDLFLIGP